MLVTSFQTRCFIPEEATLLVTITTTPNLNYTPVKWSARPKYGTFGLLTREMQNKMYH